MKTIIRRFNVYTAAELAEHHPDRFDREHEKFVENRRDYDWQETADECMASLQAVLRNAGASTHKWEICDPGYGHSHMAVDFGGDSEPENLSGPRALAWLENRVYAPLRVEWEPYLRVPWTGLGLCRTRRAESARWEADRPGTIPDCPLTGMWCDHEIIDTLANALRNGKTVADAFQSVVERIAQLATDEADHRTSRASFIEWCDSNEITFEVEAHNAA